MCSRMNEAEETPTMEGSNKEQIQIQIHQFNTTPSTTNKWREASTIARPLLNNICLMSIYSFLSVNDIHAAMLVSKVWRIDQSTQSLFHRLLQQRTLHGTNGRTNDPNNMVEPSISSVAYDLESTEQIIYPGPFSHRHESLPWRQHHFGHYGAMRHSLIRLHDVTYPNECLRIERSPVEYFHGIPHHVLNVHGISAAIELDLFWTQYDGIIEWLQTGQSASLSRQGTIESSLTVLTIVDVDSNILTSSKLTFAMTAATNPFIQEDNSSNITKLDATHSTDSILNVTAKSIVGSPICSCGDSVQTMPLVFHSLIASTCHTEWTHLFLKYLSSQPHNQLVSASSWSDSSTLFNSRFVHEGFHAPHVLGLIQQCFFRRPTDTFSDPSTSTSTDLQFIANLFHNLAQPNALSPDHQQPVTRHIRLLYIDLPIVDLFSIMHIIFMNRSSIFMQLRELYLTHVEAELAATPLLQTLPWSINHQQHNQPIEFQPRFFHHLGKALGLTPVETEEAMEAETILSQLQVLVLSSSPQNGCYIDNTNMILMLRWWCHHLKHLSLFNFKLDSLSSITQSEATPQLQSLHIMDCHIADDDGQVDWVESVENTQCELIQTAVRHPSISSLDACRALCMEFEQRLMQTFPSMIRVHGGRVVYWLTFMLLLLVFDIGWYGTKFGSDMNDSPTVIEATNQMRHSMIMTAIYLTVISFFTPILIHLVSESPLVITTGESTSSLYLPLNHLSWWRPFGPYICCIMVQFDIWALDHYRQTQPSHWHTILLLPLVVLMMQNLLRLIWTSKKWTRGSTRWSTRIIFVNRLIILRLGILLSIIYIYFGTNHMISLLSQHFANDHLILDVTVQGRNSMEMTERIQIAQRVPPVLSIFMEWMSISVSNVSVENGVIVVRSAVTTSFSPLNQFVELFCYWLIHPILFIYPTLTLLLLTYLTPFITFVEELFESTYWFILLLFSLVGLIDSAPMTLGLIFTWTTKMVYQELLQQSIGN